MGEEALAPAIQVLAGMEAWQQAFFGGTHAVHSETQSEDIATDAADEKGEEAETSRVTKRKAEATTRRLRWTYLHGISAQEAIQLEEAAGQPTLPLPTQPEGDSADSAMARTFSRHRPDQRPAAWGTSEQGYTIRR